jgi:ribonuclease J
MPITTITCYGGAGEVGGNKILLEDGDVRVFLDFGTAFNPHHAFFSDMLRPRATRGLLDLLVLGLLPPLEGLYREDLSPRGLWARLRSSPLYRDLRRRDGRPAVDAVLISHAHLDHNGDLAYLDTSIPVYSSRITAFIARAMQLTGSSGLERELTFASPRVVGCTGDLHTDPRAACQARPHAFVDGALTRRARAFWRRAPSRGKTLEMADAHKTTGALRALRLRAWPVDHSVPGAIGLAVETSAGWIGYSGDIRFHGKCGDQTRRFAQELAALRPAVLICEGTHTQAAGRLTEAGIVENALPLLRDAAGQLAVADFGARNVERLLSFAEIAAQAGRSLVIQPKDLYLLHAIALADPDTFPGPLELPSLLLFDNPKATRRLWERALPCVPQWVRHFPPII